LKARQSSLGESITILSLTPKINFQQDEKERKKILVMLRQEAGEKKN
jgi:hypothetical protein